MSEDEKAGGAVRLAHRVLLLEREAEADCVVVGHAWIAEEEDGGSICLVCSVVRRGAPAGAPV